jgi:Arc/MetJ-type ribon-helix-helix transcriptional regulator
MTVTLSLPPELEAELAKRVESGRFASVDEVVCEALRVYIRYERATDECVRLLEQEAEIGMKRYEFWEYSESAENALDEIRTQGMMKLKRSM